MGLREWEFFIYFSKSKKRMMREERKESKIKKKNTIERKLKGGTKNIQIKYLKELK